MSLHVAQAPLNMSHDQHQGEPDRPEIILRDTVLLRKAPPSCPLPPPLFPPFVVLMNERRPERQPPAEDRRSISGGDERPRWQSAETLVDNLPGEAASDAVARPRTPELIRLPSASIRRRWGEVRWGGRPSPLQPAGGSGRFTADPLADKETTDRCWRNPLGKRAHAPRRRLQ